MFIIESIVLMRGEVGEKTGITQQKSVKPKKIHIYNKPQENVKHLFGLSFPYSLHFKTILCWVTFFIEKV